MGLQQDDTTSVNTTARSNPTLLPNSGLIDVKGEERVLQLLRIFNHLLGKHKQTSPRFLNMTVARVVAVYPQTRLVQDNPASASLLEIYQGRCAQRE